MRALLASYSAGILVVTLSPALFWVSLVSSGALWLGCVLWLVFWHKGLQAKLCSRFALLVCAASAGALWHSAHAAWQLKHQLAEEVDGEIFQVRGYVSGLAQRRGLGWQFDFEIINAERAANPKPQSKARPGEALQPATLPRSGFSGKTLLSFYPEEANYAAVYKTGPSELRERAKQAEPPSALEIPAELRPGTTLNLSVRLSSPRGLANPGVYDREAALFREGILATGSVRSGLNKCQERCGASARAARSFMVWVHQQRFDLRQRLLANTLELKHPELIVALGLGDGSLLSRDQWDLLRATGTVHLVVVSGLHIALASLLFYGLAYALWSVAVLLKPRWACEFTRQKFCGCCLLLGAGSFALSSGWGLPVQRALTMLFVAVVARLVERRFGSTASLLAAASAVLTLTPLAATAQGFWLSFAAVAALLYTLNRDPSSGKWSLGRLVGDFAKPQLVIAVALALPLTLLGNPISLTAPLINFLAIPFLSMALLPAVLLTLVDHLLRDMPSTGLLVFADRLSSWLLSALRCASDSPLNIETASAPSTGLIFAAGLLALALLVPLARNSRLLLLSWLSLSLLGNRWAGDSPHQGSDRAKCSSASESLEVHVIDVGQGLAVALRSRCHTLLYDTAARFVSGADRGELIVAPSLRALGVERIDRLIISHADNDHAGGIAGVSAAMPIRSLMVSGAAKNYSLLSEAQRAVAVSCKAGQSWRWDGVEFVVLMPSQPADQSSASGNAQSCVLKASLGEHSVLLSGDIERAQELRIHASHSRWQAGVLLAPHHGSATSSSFPLLKRVAPSTVVISAAHNNAFGHPHADVVKRYELLGIDTINTAKAGMVSLVSGTARSSWRVAGHRESKKRYWRPR